MLKMPLFHCLTRCMPSQQQLIIWKSSRRRFVFDPVQHDAAVSMDFLAKKPLHEDDEKATLSSLDMLPPESSASHHLEGRQGQNRQHSESFEEREQKFKRLCKSPVALYETKEKLKAKRFQTEMAMLTLQKAQDAEAGSQQELMSRESACRRDLAS
ncbi:hypothetical protein Slin15195_G040690 [Septoria linicola]|uniref:Uncharacterized protein n=1 Tax=Septoria linicola TaxID=215465 RepID=A0A9Q9AKL0_9PEZI|nr:hypothetical protein Slin14017_G044220 [Septoria linicola]USW50750.1 hypothetical protein Slin15195_G040690 [Septoria linicola]